MQLCLDKQLSSLDLDKLSIGINQVAQAPQDCIQMFCEGCQTDFVMTHDIGTDTRKITLDSNIQCDTQCFERYSQTEKPYGKVKHIQTVDFNCCAYVQTDKPKLRNSQTQSDVKYINAGLQTIVSRNFNSMDASTETEKEFISNELLTNEHMELKEEPIEDFQHNNVFPENGITVTQTKVKVEKSESPPLSPDKTATSSLSFTFPFVSLISPLAARLTTLGIFMKTFSFFIICNLHICHNNVL